MKQDRARPSHALDPTIKSWKGTALSISTTIEPDSDLDGFSRGVFVRMRHDPARRGMVSDVFITPAGRGSIRVFFGPTDHPWVDSDQLELDVSFDARLVTSEQLLRDIALAKYKFRLSDSLYSYGTSRTEFAPYQFRPVIKFLRAWQEEDKRGLLIADEVGLGKTIEAAIILQELKARTSVEHVLVVCPSKLTHKWQDELRHRFNESFHVWDGETVRQTFRRDLAAQSIRPFRAIASLEMLRMSEMLDLLQDERLRLDYLIIDESHHMRNAESSSYRLGQRLADVSDAVV